MQLEFLRTFQGHLGPFVVVTALLFAFGACKESCDRTPTTTDNPHAANVKRDGATKDDTAKDNNYYANRLSNEWNDLKDAVKKRWDRLTNEDIAEIKGDFNRLSEKIKEKYYQTKDDADREIKDFFDKLR